MQPGQQPDDERRDGAGIERLGHVARRPERVRLHPALGRELAGDEDERQGTRAFVAAEACSERKAVEHRHAHVEEDKVGALVEGALETKLAVLGLDHLHAGLDEAGRAQRPDPGVVVHDQYSEGPLRPRILGAGRLRRFGRNFHEPSSSTWHAGRFVWPVRAGGSGSVIRGT